MRLFSSFIGKEKLCGPDDNGLEQRSEDVSIFS